MKDPGLKVVRDGLDIDRKVMAPGDLRGAEWNPNEMTRDEFEMLKEGIKKFGFIDPPTVARVQSEDGSTYYEIVGGHNRVAAACDLGLPSIPVDILQGDKWQEEDIRKFQAVRFNVLHGSMNPEKMMKLYNDMAAKYGKKVTRMLGYASDDGIKKMIKQVSDGLRGSIGPEAAADFESRARKSKTSGDIGRVVSEIMSEHGETVDYNFVIFSWGGKDHIYIAMCERLRDAMKIIMDASRQNVIDINDYLTEAVEDAAARLRN